MAAILVAGLVATLVIAPGAHASLPRLGQKDLVVLGDSFAAGTGNLPYEVPDCGGRSLYHSYGKYLGAWGLVRSVDVAACGGDTTEEVLAQLPEITAETDVVTVQAIGNDFHFGRIAALCLGAFCGRTTALYPPTTSPTIGEIIASIPADAKSKLDVLFAAIKAATRKQPPAPRVLVVPYGNPFPSPGTDNASRCPAPGAFGAMNAEELQVAKDFADALNAALRSAATRHGFRFVNAAPWFVGHDVCGSSSAFFRPAPPDQGGPPAEDPAAVLHPNRFGQAIYAAAVASRLLG